MYSDKTRKTTWVLCLLILCVIAGAACYWAVSSGNRNLQEESAAALQQSVTDAARQCYVVEGAYPADLTYLEDNYGLQINEDDYFVTYDAFARNLPPAVKVTLRR